MTAGDQSAYEHLRRLAFPAHVRAIKKASRNLEHERSRSRKYQKEHPELRARARRKWQQKHPDKICAYSSLRRARMLGASLGNPNAVKEFYSWLRQTAIVICHWCRDVVPPKLRCGDHVIPLVLGGAHSLENLVPACNSCNSRKGSKLPEDFLLTCSR